MLTLSTGTLQKKKISLIEHLTYLPRILLEIKKDLTRLIARLMMEYSNNRINQKLKLKPSEKKKFPEKHFFIKL